MQTPRVRLRRGLQHDGHLAHSVNRPREAAPDPHLRVAPRPDLPTSCSPEVLTVCSVVGTSSSTLRRKISALSWEQTIKNLTGEPFAKTNDTFISFQFWEGSSTSYSNVCSFTFNIADPLFNGTEPIGDASYFGADESTGNTLDSGTLSATTTGIDAPSTLILFAFGALAMRGCRSQFFARGQS